MTFLIMILNLKVGGLQLYRKVFHRHLLIDQFFEIDDDYDVNYIISAANDTVKYLNKEELKSAYNDLLHGSQNDYENLERHYESERVHGTYELVFKGSRERQVFHNIKLEYIPQYVSRVRSEGIQFNTENTYE